MRHQVYCGLAVLLLSALPAQAATVFLVPTSPLHDLVAGDPVTADIVLNFPDVATIGFSVDIYFSDNLEFVSYTDAGLGDPQFTRPPDHPWPGYLEAASTASFHGLPQFGVVASIEFRYLYRAHGFIALANTNSLAGPPWISADDFVSIIPVELNRLDYPIPLPAALWLFTNALALGQVLGWRRKQH